MVRQELRLLKDVPLDRDSFTIGRLASCDVQLDHPDVSRVHARIELRDGRWLLVDKRRGRGVRLNGRTVSEATLTPGDVIDIRPFSLNFLGSEAAADSATLDRSLQLSARDSIATYVRDPRRPDVIIRQRLEDLYAIARLVLARKDNGSFWQTMHAALQRCLGADRCVLVGLDEKGRPYRLAPRARSSSAEPPLGISGSVLRDTVNAGKAMLIEAVQTDARYADAKSLVDHRSGSVICVPVMVDDRTRAVVYADRLDSRGAFQAADLDFAVAAVDLAATAVSLDELQAQTRELARLRGRIDVGREMQKMLLPDPLPQPAWGELAALNHPADQMSGDIYDASIDAAGRLIVSLADVAGKGVPAAFGTAILQSALRQAIQVEDDLRGIVCFVNSAFEKSSPLDCFATMLICRFSASGEQVEIANAGHHAPLWLMSDGKVEAFPARVGIPIGILPDWPNQTQPRDVRADVMMVLSSDGLTECRNPQGDEYGLERPARCLAGLADHSARNAAMAIANDARAFGEPGGPEDDLTLLTVRRNAV